MSNKYQKITKLKSKNASNRKIATLEKRKNIKELFDNFDGPYKKEDINWGKPQRKEIW